MSRKKRTGFRRRICGAMLLAAPWTGIEGVAQTETNEASVLELKGMPLEELMRQEVRSPGRKVQLASQVATAIEVITDEEIRRSGVMSIPEALRLATGVHVAQTDAHSWAISARGFNSSIGNFGIANKLQVLMDGRSLYNPLFSGVYWDVQNYLLEDIKQIEVIRGPGATMWGANAFNGVINIVTKSAKETQGTLVTGGGGTELQGFGGLRYGGTLGEKTYYRVYATYFNRDEMSLPSGAGANDGWMLGQTGFRADTELNDVNSLTVQGDYYNGAYETGGEDGRLGGGNVLGRWTRTFGDESDFSLQAYWDRTHRRQFNLVEDLDTLDVDGQHRFPVGERHLLMWGFNYRLNIDRIEIPTQTFEFIPADRSMQLFSAFIQDEVRLFEDKISVTVGSKFEHNDFTGFEIQPSIRAAYMPTERQTVWAGISRAVRTPTRLEVDWSLPPVLRNQPRDKYGSEEVIAYEVGYRISPHKRVSYDLALFYNDYDQIRSVEALPGGPFFRNEYYGRGYGVELTQTYQLLDFWRIRAGYAYLNIDLEETSDHRPVPGISTALEGNDPSHLLTLLSTISLPFDVEFDQVLRFVDDLPDPRVPSYWALDLRLGWRPMENLELAIVGRNLLDNQHPEHGPAGPGREEVDRSVYGKVTWKF